MGIADERRIAELRYRRSRNKALIRAIGYITSIIPAILIAANFETFRQYVIVAFGGQVAPPAQAAQAADKPKPQPIKREVERRPVEQPRIQPHVEERPPVQVPDEAAMRPVTKPPKLQVSKPDLSFSLELERKKQVVSVPSIGPGQHVRLKRDGDDECKVFCDSEGALPFGGKFNPRALLSLENQSKGATLAIEFVVDSVSGRQVPFTIPNLTTIRRRAARNVARCAATLAALEREQLQVDTYLKSYRGKLWTEKRAAEDRRAILPKLIAAAGNANGEAAVALASVDELIERAKSIHGSNVELFVAAPQ